MAYKTLKHYRKDILKAFDRAGGINRLKNLMSDDDIFLYMVDKICKLLPREQHNTHDHNINYISNTPRPTLPNPNKHTDLDNISYSTDKEYLEDK